MPDWLDLHHSELTKQQLHDVLARRAEVFVVEQRCDYLDVDGADLREGTRHLLGTEAGDLVCYARVLAPGSSGVAKLGRVLVVPAARGRGLGRETVHRALASCAEHWPGAAVFAQAQAHLLGFYTGFGFSAISEVYEDAGIPHIDMVRPAG